MSIRDILVSRIGHYESPERIDGIISEIKQELINALPDNPELLHEWYLEATMELKPESYNPKAQKPFSELTHEQRYIDTFISNKFRDEVIKAIDKMFGM
jgi:hypothetical protein